MRPLRGTNAMAVSLFSPAKLNLYLAVTGRRADGFHDLVSVAAPLDFGDTLEARPGRDGFRLECDDPGIPADGTNLVLRAAAAFAAATGWRQPVDFRLTKRVPAGAGLGGGSSNAVAALRALNELAGGPLDAAGLAAVAADLGSDCTLFLAGGPVVLRGRGERVTPLPAAAAARLRGQRVLVFKPSFAIATAWAYGRLAKRGADYLAAPAAEARLAAWVGSAAPAGALLFNNLQPAAFEKYLALPVLLARLRAECGVPLQMSGSGSACFALTGDGGAVPALAARIRECWGGAAFVQAARLA
ncbi:MAG: 4-(cytidine 5'-diphospho)-2-C-methyl-D-erythritol kinase [Opitutaceae bacterium]|nr:4-(cytidine 5'-diphospho)-2-C-methyl-D-erythritol kinase [Opitutaceae bacterium]